MDNGYALFLLRKELQKIEELSGIFGLLPHELNLLERNRKSIQIAIDKLTEYGDII